MVLADWLTRATAPETRALLDFARALRYQDLPEQIVAEAKRNLLDFAGVTVGGSQEPAARLTLEQVRELGGQPQATIFPSGHRTSVVNAALVLGVMAHVLDFDDTHMPTILHGTTPVTAAALPVAEWRGSSGRDLIVAYVAGFEVAARVALALHPSHYEIGWHVTGTVGTLGAAAAAARLLGLDAAGFTVATGMAATQAAAHREHFGSMSKSLGVGKAAANGTLAALLAGRGFDAAADGLQGRRGMLSVMATASDPAQLDRDLGSRWELLHSGLKPYPCGVVAHPAIDVALRLRRAHGLEPDQIVGVDAHVHPLVVELTGKQQPRTGLEGKFSVAYAMAVALSEGLVGPQHFAGHGSASATVERLRGLVSLTPDGTLTEGQAHATARLRDGREVTERVELATGMPGNPLSDDEAHAKFHNLADPVLGAAPAARVAALVADLDTLPTLQPLLDSLQPPAAAT